jgi:hypothetical protein
MILWIRRGFLGIRQRWLRLAPPERRRRAETFVCYVYSLRVRKQPFVVCDLLLIND